jgi:hypothetical protein
LDLFTLAHSTKKQGPIIAKPKNYHTMLALAEELSQPFDFVRVDLYNIDGKIYFGELTHYPRSGYTDIPYEFDLRLGNTGHCNQIIGKPKGTLSAL